MVLTLTRIIPTRKNLNHIMRGVPISCRRSPTCFLLEPTHSVFQSSCSCILLYDLLDVVLTNVGIVQRMPVVLVVPGGYETTTSFAVGFPTDTLGGVMTLYKVVKSLWTYNSSLIDITGFCTTFRRFSPLFRLLCHCFVACDHYCVKRRPNN